MILLLAAAILFLFPSPVMNRVGFACISLGVFLVVKRLAKQLPEEQKVDEKSVAGTKPKADLPLTNAYQRKWLFSFNEKDAYFKLKPIAEELGYTVFTKVRLLDLLEPKKGSQMYRRYFNKVQAKHVDFVLCDKKLVARIIIELDDSSHDNPDRQARDSFVDTILIDVGYKIIHTRAITDDLKKQLC